MAPFQAEAQQWLGVMGSPVISLILAVFLGVSLLLRAIVQRYWKRYLNLPGKQLSENGPQADSFYRGSLPTLGERPTGEPTDAWFEQYGSTILFRNSLYRPDIMTRDRNFIKTVLHSNDFDSGEASMRFSAMLGIEHSLTGLTGPDHRRVRRIMTPALGAPAIRQMWPDILDKARKVQEKIAGECRDAGGSKMVSALQYAGFLTIEVLGKCGFGQDLEVIESGKPSEMQMLLAKLISTGPKMDWLDYLTFGFGAVLDKFVTITTRQKNTREVKDALKKTAAAIIAQRTAEIRAESSLEAKGEDFGNKDMVSYLLRANMASDVKTSMRMTDEELRDQIPLLLIAGNVTTLNTIGWGCYYLASNKEAQDRLRTEVKSVGTDDPTFDQINKLEYLEAVVRETTRLYSAAATQMRSAVRTTVVQLAEPVKGRDGKMMHTVTVDKGTNITIPNINTNTVHGVFGSDAWEFRPERQLGEQLDGAKEYGSVWGNNITFSGGDRGCIGYRMAVAELKAIFFVLLREFEILQPAGQKLRRYGMVVGARTEETADEKVDVKGIPIRFKLL